MKRIADLVYHYTVYYSVFKYGIKKEMTNLVRYVFTSVQSRGFLHAKGQVHARLV